MKLYIVCLLVALSCMAVKPAPAPQQSGNLSASPTIGPLTTLYDLFTMFPSTVISSTQNAIREIPFMNLFPAALQTGLLVGKNFAEGMDHTLTGLTGRRGGSNPFAALLNPLGLTGGGQNNAGGQIGAGQPNPLNGFGNLMNNLNPLNYLNGLAQQNGQRPGYGQVNPLGAIGNTLNNFNPLNLLQGAGQQNSNGNNPLATLSNGAVQALNQLSPLQLAQYLNTLQQNSQSPNTIQNIAPNFIPNGVGPVPTANPGNVPAPLPAPAPVPVRQQNKEI